MHAKKHSHMKACREPCPPDCAGDENSTGACDNRLLAHVVHGGRAAWLGQDMQGRGLFAGESGIEAGTFIATFGPLRQANTQEGAQSQYTIEVTCGVRREGGGSWTRGSQCLVPASNWLQAGHLAPLANHSCSPDLRNAELVVTEAEDGGGTPSVLLRTTVEVIPGAEIFVDYGTRAHTVVGQCVCPGCTPRTPHPVVL